MASEQPAQTESVEVCNRKVPKSVVVQILQNLDKPTLKVVSQVSKTFHQLSRHPSLVISAMYSGPNTQLPELQAVIPFPPPAALQTTLPNVTTVNPAPQYSTVLPESTKVMLPVLPETVPLIAQVPDVVTTSVTSDRATSDDTEKPVAKEVVQISQVLPGYAPSYAQDYVPTEVNNLSFSTFANTISFNVSRYPTMVESTDSKKYAEKYKGKKDDTKVDEKDEKKTAGVSAEDALKGVKPGGLNMTTGNDNKIEYIPAQYGRGVDSDNLMIQTVSASKSISIVKPDVLASGRVLTYMTPVPSQSTTSSTTTLSSIITFKPSEVVENGQSNGHSGDKTTNPNNEPNEDKTTSPNGANL